ncbi:hypothetical protein Syun_027476 [Stephania yunnanensis]|uniref:Uncharacterized protein n=1 Tax=Stephania yunnanensis TaxID=152371 RepID=A0AAP0HRA6_9MAGN
MEKKWVFPLAICSTMCLFLVVTSFNLGIISSFHTINSIFSIFPLRAFPNQTKIVFIEEKISHPPPQPEKSSIPRLAYLVSGSKGDLEKLWRTLQALYHPWNEYIVHLESESRLEERLELASRIEKDPIFSKVGNVEMITKANMVTYKGPTMVANTLHAYILFTFSKLKRNLNFVEHTSRLGWKETYRAKPLIIDPGLYRSTKADVFWVSEKRSVPTAFKLFTGSAWMALSNSFVEYVIWGWDNLPRTVLMYYANFVSSPEGYFQTVICNNPEFASTVVNHDLHYISWDVPPKQHPHSLGLKDSKKMIFSNAPFARKFKRDVLVLDKIDKELLNRSNGSFTPGGWCSDPRCSQVGDPSQLTPEPGARRLNQLISRLLLSSIRNRNQCK